MPWFHWPLPVTVIHCFQATVVSPLPSLVSSSSAVLETTVQKSAATPSSSDGLAGCPQITVRSSWLDPAFLRAERVSLETLCVKGTADARAQKGKRGENKHSPLCWPHSAFSISSPPTGKVRLLGPGKQTVLTCNPEVGSTFLRQTGQKQL